MKLYHFTTADKVIAIREYGLLPSLEPVMSPDHAVVWLTSQPDVSLTEQDAKAMALWLHLYEAPLEERDTAPSIPHVLVRSSATP